MSGNTTNYTLDLNTGLTQVLNDGTNQYLYGLGRIAQVNTSTEYLVSTSSTYHLPDALGSVRQLTDASGQVTLANAYEPYGNLAQTVGSAQTSYGFTGEQTDPSGMVYLRARYYNPNAGRFVSKDTWAGNVNQPLSLNQWNYTNSNPINWVDPSGNITQDDNIQALIIAEDLRIRFNVEIIVDWGYLNWLPGLIYRLDIPNFNCDEWQYGRWRNLRELELVREGVERLATKMGGPEKFKSAMQYQPVEIARVQTLPYPFEKNSGLALPFIEGYFMVNGLMLPDPAFDGWPQDEFGIYTVIHELGHVWDVRSNFSLSIGMADILGNVSGGNGSVFSECSGRLSIWRNPIIRFLCANGKYEYIEANEATPGDPNRTAPNDPTKKQPYAGDSITEDWADAVAYTVYPEYATRVRFREVLPIRKSYVEIMMALIP